MPQTLRLLGRRPITFESAAMEEKNVINWASYGPATEKFYEEIWGQRDSIQALVKHHMGIATHEACNVLPPNHWIRGSFNVCVIVEVTSSCRKVVFRCPMPHKLAEAEYPGSIDEKLGCEVGAHAWVEEKCLEIRTPHLFGFGFMDGRHFTHARHVSFLALILRKVSRSIHKLCGLPLLSNYVWHPPRHQVSSAYMLLEYLDTGQVLSDTFHIHRDDKVYRQRLFRGVSQILLSLAHIPQPQIGSFQFHDNGTVSLTNRPLCCSMIILENDGAARTMGRDATYSCTDAFVSDMLSFHDQRFLSQPNAVYSEDDCRGQMAVKTLLRVLAHRYIKRGLRNGPFILQFTDFHASNILVDEDWNITGLVDLEWICALPSEMLEVPYWLTGCAIDQIKGERFDHFNEIRREFMDIFEKEERAMKAKSQHIINLSNVIKDMWESKGVWFWNCLSSVNAMYVLFEEHLCPPESFSVEAERTVSKFWCKHSEDVVQAKLAEKRAYDDKLRELFVNEGLELS